MVEYLSPPSGIASPQSGDPLAPPLETTNDNFGDIEGCDHGNCTFRPCGSVYNTSTTLLWARTASVRGWCKNIPEKLNPLSRDVLRLRPQRSLLSSDIASCFSFLVKRDYVTFG